MTKRLKTKKNEADEFLSKNHAHKVKYRKRIQEDLEKHKELKDFFTNAETEIQNPIRRNHFQD